MYDPKYNVNKDIFVSLSNSTMFTDCLVVIPQGKAASFVNEMSTMMSDYYGKLDQTESRRFKDQAKIRLNEIKDNGKEEETKEFIESVVVFAKEMTHPLASEIEAWRTEHEKYLEVASDMLVAEMESKLAERMQHRCPGVIVPGSFVPLPQM